MTETELIAKIRHANLDELNTMAYNHACSSLHDIQTINKNATMDMGRITIELCARKKELTESPEAGKEYRDNMLRHHLASSAEFADLSVQEGLITQADADELKTDTLKALERLYDVEKKVDFKWLVHFTNKYRAEHPELYAKYASERRLQS